MDDNAIRPGATLNKLNPWTDLTAEERAARIAEFRALGDQVATPEGRLAVMDAQGVEGTLMFPQREGLIVHDCFPDDAAATFANVRAFNRYVAEEWGFARDNRIFIPAAMSFLDVDLAIAELERLIDDGVRTILLPPGPINRRSPADPEFDPFWRRAGSRTQHRGAPQLHRVSAAIGDVERGSRTSLHEATWFHRIPVVRVLG